MGSWVDCARRCWHLRRRGLACPPDEAWVHQGADALQSACYAHGKSLAVGGAQFAWQLIFYDDVPCC